MANRNSDELELEEEIILNLELEDGGEIECQVECIFEYDGNHYAALIPTDEMLEERYFFGVEMEDKGEETEFTLTNIEDDDLLEELSEAYEEAEDGDESEWDEFINKKLDD
ncbi:MAG: DUF1292 domain-containing protein [Lachnospiraceae bacterium]|nr:DUF1292 domain-containing protein [Lachnospiraceae bacterium]